jgi:hypothetical protein
LGSEEGGSDVEYGQVGDEVDRRLPLLTREHPDAREEILIREARRESERVRIHAFVYHDEFSGLGEGSGGRQGRRAEAGSAHANPSARERRGRARTRFSGVYREDRSAK